MPEVGMVTEEQLLAIMPHASPLRMRTHAPHLNTAMSQFRIDTVLREAAFIAQLAHESIQFRAFEELPHTHPVSWCSLCRRTGKGHAAGEQYEGRADLGNSQPGDGVRYKGRGAIQLTGRLNYRRAGLALGIDLEGRPELAETVEVAFLTAGWFWATHGCNLLADRSQFDAITRAINGGYNGKASRDAFYARALQVLGSGEKEGEIRRS